MSPSARDKLATLEAVDGLVAGGLSVSSACRRVGVSASSVSRWRAAYEAGGVAGLEDGQSSGRPPVHEWPEEDVAAIKAIAVRTNRGRDAVSLSHAVRRAVFEGVVSEETAAVLRRETASKHYIPESLRSQIEVAPQVVRRHRSGRDARLRGAYVPGSTRLVADGSRRLRAGERFSFDDGSQNQVVVVPWPYGGSKEADKFGHRTCRGQWLVAHDDATGMVVGWVFTLRPRDSYRAADALGLMYRVSRDVCRPIEMVLEGGVWQARQSLAFLKAAGITLRNAKGRPNLKLVENFFGRAWTFLSVYERGQIGRFRGEYEEENKLLMRARAGTVDGREHFPLLPELLRELDACVRFLNGDRIESPEYGRWVPQERWDEDMAAYPREKLGAELAPYAAPEVRTLTVRRGGMVVAQTVCPLGIPSTYSFADEALMAWEGRKVRIAFDPFEEVVRAAIFEPKKSEPICMATCMNPPPAPVAAQDWEILRSYAATDAAIGVKKAMSNAVRTEYRSVVAGGRAMMSEQRGPDGVARIEQVQPTGAGDAGLLPSSPPITETGLHSARRAGFSSRRAKRLEAADVERLQAEADALEARLRRTGDLVSLPGGGP